MVKHTPRRPGPPHRTRQQGSTLLAGLIFMTILTLIGVTASKVSSLEERMSGNLRDRSIAMQAAEMALRDAERDISKQSATRSPPIEGISGFVADCGLSTSSDANDDGLCYNGSTGYGTPIWQTANMEAAPSVRFGSFTGADDIPLVSAQPRYIIEGMRKTPPGKGESYYYRITVRAQGMDDNTVVWVQELYKP